MLLRVVILFALVSVRWSFDGKLSNRIEWEILSDSFIDSITQFIGSILKPACNSFDIYQLNFIQLFNDPYSNVVMNGVLKYISGAACSHKIITQYSNDRLGSSNGAQYYVVFCHTLVKNVLPLQRFVMERQFYHGNARYLFVTLLNNGSVYDSRFFIRENDRYRLHNLFMIKYDAFGWYSAGFIHPFTLREQQYQLGQEIEQTFQANLKNTHGYKFIFNYVRVISANETEYRKYGYFFHTMAKARGGRATVSSSLSSDVVADFMLVDDIYYNFKMMKTTKLLPMNHFRYLCAVTPAQESEVSWLRVFIDPFHWTVWTTFLIVIELFAVFIYQFGYRSNIRRGLLTIHFELFQTFIDGPLNRRRNRLEAVAIGMFVLLSMILMTVYESSLVSSMSVKRFYPEINTIDEVNNSRYPVAILRTTAEQFNLSFKKMLYFGEDEQFKKNKGYNITDYQFVKACDTDNLFSHIVEDGRMHTVAERFASQTDNFAIGAFSPYGEMVYNYWNIFMEADLFNYWQLRVFVPKYFNRKTEHKIRSFTLKDMNVAWFVVMVGLSASGLVFIVELCSLICYRDKVCSALFVVQDFVQALMFKKSRETVGKMDRRGKTDIW